MDYVTYQDVYGTLSLYDVLEKEEIHYAKAEGMRLRNKH